MDAIDAPDAPPTPVVGELDPTFGGAGIAVLDRGTVGTGYGLLSRANGGVVVVGVIELSQGVHAAELTAWTALGTLDPSYGTNGRFQLSLARSTWAYGARRLPDGRAIIWGDGVEVDTQADDLMYALLDESDVPLGPLSHIDVQTDDTANGAVPRPDGGFVFCGVAHREQTDTHYTLAFTTADRTLDGSIGSNGVLYDDESVGAFDRCWDMDLDAQGRLITAGTGDNDLMLTRHLATGARDASFGGGGRVRIAALEGEGYAVALAPDGDLVMVGVDDASGVVARFDANGNLRSSFGDGGIVRYLDAGPQAYDVFYDVLVEADGSVIVGGVHGRAQNEDAQLLRFDVNGALDPTFGDGGVIRINRGGSDHIFALARAPGGGVFATGETNGTTWLIKVR